MESRPARSKLDVIYQDGLADYRILLDRADEIKISIEKCADDAIERISSHTGAIIAASEDLNASADILVEKKLREVHDVITTVVEASMKEALGRHVTGEVTRLKSEISQIASELRGTLINARKSQATTAAMGGVVGGLLVLLLSWAFSGNGTTATADSSAPVAQQTASNTKQLPRNR